MTVAVPFELTPAKLTSLSQVATAEGKSQLDLARALKIPPSWVVALVDELERRRLLRRRADPADHRVRTLHLRPRGKQMIGRLSRVVAEHENTVCGGLDHKERQALLLLLRKAAAGLGLANLTRRPGRS